MVRPLSCALGARSGLDCRTARLLATLIILAWGQLATAIVVEPPGLSPGDQYRLAFYTDGTRDALSSDIEDYNTFVSDAANAVPALAALGATWKVIGSTSAVDARDNTGTNEPLGGLPIYNLAGLRVAADNTVLWTETACCDEPVSLENPINKSETGATSTLWVWTGTTPHGVVFGAHPLGSDARCRGGGMELTPNAAPRV